MFQCKRLTWKCWTRFVSKFDSVQFGLNWGCGFLIPYCLPFFLYICVCVCVYIYIHSHARAQYICCKSPHCFDFNNFPCGIGWWWIWSLNTNNILMLRTFQESHSFIHTFIHLFELYPALLPHHGVPKAKAAMNLSINFTESLCWSQNEPHTHEWTYLLYISGMVQKPESFSTGNF